MKKTFEIKAIPEQEVSLSTGSELLSGNSLPDKTHRLRMLKPLCGLILAGSIMNCGRVAIGLPIAYSKELTLQNSSGVLIPGLSVKLSEVNDTATFGEFFSDEFGKVRLITGAALPLEIIITDTDGSTNGTYSEKTIPFDDTDPEIVEMD